MSAGYVYVLTNPCMPHLVKIGRTYRSVEQRARELQASGVPAPFDVYASVLAPDCAAVEVSAHALLYRDRLAGNREFFRVLPAEAESAIRTALADQLVGLISPYVSSDLKEAIFKMVERDET